MWQRASRAFLHYHSAFGMVLARVMRVVEAARDTESVIDFVSRIGKGPVKTPIHPPPNLPRHYLP